MKNGLIIFFLLSFSISGFSQKADIQVIRTGNAGSSEWQILDQSYNQAFSGSMNFSGDSVSFTLEPGEIYYLHVTVFEIFDRTTDLYSLVLNGEPLLLVKSDIEQGDHIYPFFTGIEYIPGKIVGGTTADIAEFPWQVYFRAGGYMCGGTLISTEWVVTAAHCAQESNGSAIPIDEMFIVAGSSNPSNRNEGAVYRVSQVIVHENFNSQALTNDIALLRLQNPVINQNAKPIRLITPGDVNEGATLPGVMSWVTGWGLTRVNPDMFPTLLQKVQLPIVSNQQASLVWGSIPSNVIMAGYSDGNKDACNGDSGGPLVVPVSGEFKLAGITSWGSEDCDTYSGFTKVSGFTAWIIDKTGIPPVFAPSVPEGSEIICQGVTSSQYSIEPVASASGYEWELFPESAGSISGNSSSIVVNWNTRFFGEVTVKARVIINTEVSEWSRLPVLKARTTRLVSQSGSQDICQRQPISLSVVAEGNNLIYDWYKDGVIIRSGSSSQYNISNSSSAHSGDYSVEIRGACGSVVSSIIRVNVLPLTNINYVTRDTTVTFGDDANLTVYAEGHNLSYTWLKDNETISTNSNNLLLQNANANDIGVYQTIVNGTCGTMISNDFYVYVERVDVFPEQDIFVWPTVTNDIINVALSTDDTYDIQIFSSTGLLIKQLRNCRYVTTLNVSTMGRGIYIINVNSNNFRKSLKFIII